jgi:hypothetical protein
MIKKKKNKKKKTGATSGWKRLGLGTTGMVLREKSRADLKN